MNKSWIQNQMLVSDFEMEMANKLYERPHVPFPFCNFGRFDVARIGCSFMIILA